MARGLGILLYDFREGAIGLTLYVEEVVRMDIIALRNL